MKILRIYTVSERIIINYRKLILRVYLGQDVFKYYVICFYSRRNTSRYIKPDRFIKFFDRKKYRRIYLKEYHDFEEALFPNMRDLFPENCKLKYLRYRNEQNRLNRTILYNK